MMHTTPDSELWINSDRNPLRGLMQSIAPSTAQASYYNIERAGDGKLLAEELTFGDDETIFNEHSEAGAEAGDYEVVGIQYNDGDTLEVSRRTFEFEPEQDIDPVKEWGTYHVDAQGRAW